MERKLRYCSCCGREYRFCRRCHEDKDKPYWYFCFCCENCKNIYEVTSNFENGNIDANEAKVQLDKLDLSEINSFGESYKSSINKIMKSVSTKKKSSDISTSETGVNCQENNTEDVISNSIDNEEKVLKKPRAKRAKNNVE